MSSDGVLSSDPSFESDHQWVVKNTDDSVPTYKSYASPEPYCTPVCDYEVLIDLIFSVGPSMYSFVLKVFRHERFIY